MTAPNQRPTVPSVLDNHEARLRKLEAASPLLSVTYAIKVTGDNDGFNDPAQILSGAFYLGIPPELNNWYVVKFWGYQSEAGALGTDTQLRLARTEGGTVFATSTNITIPDTDLYPSVEAVINTSNNQVIGEFNFLRVDIVDVDGAYGIGVEITLSRQNSPL